MIKAYFSRIIEYDKPQATVLKGSHAIPTFTVEPIGAFL